VSWFPDRDPDPIRWLPGFVPVSVSEMARPVRVFDLGDYFRLFRAGSAPEWLFPVTIGWQF